MDWSGVDYCEETSWMAWGGVYFQKKKFFGVNYFKIQSTAAD